METGSRLLLLAGSAEARQIASGAMSLGWQVEAWVSEPPRGPNPMPVPTQLRPFDDAQALAKSMQGFDLVVDASHGFDGAMTAKGMAAAALCGLPFLSFARPAWDCVQGWEATATVSEAMALIPKKARVFSATGWASLSEYAGFKGASLMLRQTNYHTRSAPFPFVELVFGDPPFTAASETTLFRDLAVDTLICRNLGGAPSRPKLDAALALGIKVILIERPKAPGGMQLVHSVEDALTWLAAQ